MGLCIIEIYFNGFLASVYTELNAVSKGTSLGIFTKDDDRGVEAAKDGSQPYIELMGRRWGQYSPTTTTCYIELI